MYLELDDRPKRRWRWSLTVTLIVINVIAFCFQYTLLPRLADPLYFELSWPGIRSGYFWQLLTYQFMHGGIWHLVLNCWALFVFGRAVEWSVGKTRFLVLYLSSGIMGGLLQVFAAFLWPEHFGAPSVGASAGVFGVVAAFAMLFPEQRLVMLLFYVIPINMRAKTLLWFFLIVTALGISAPNSAVGALVGRNVAHFAHLGGILTGMAFSRFYFQRVLPRSPQW